MFVAGCVIVFIEMGVRPELEEEIGSINCDGEHMSATTPLPLHKHCTY
jgi:hypothetical protein